VDLSPLGGSVLSLVQSNREQALHQRVTIPATANAGAYADCDADGHLGASGSASDSADDPRFDGVWNGLGNQNWSANAAGRVVMPRVAGDTVIFAGSVGTSPNLDANYSITGPDLQQQRQQLHDRQANRVR